MIDMNKKYRTRSGLPVRILCVDRKDIFPVVYLILYEQREIMSTASIGGKYNSPRTESEWDIIEISPYEDFKIDDPVMVRDFDTEPWNRRHFAGVDEHGRAKAWDAGSTSWSVEGMADYACWNEFRRPTPEEMKPV